MLNEEDGIAGGREGGSEARGIRVELVSALYRMGGIKHWIFSSLHSHLKKLTVN